MIYLFEKLRLSLCEMTGIKIVILRFLQNFHKIRASTVKYVLTRSSVKTPNRHIHVPKNHVTIELYSNTAQI